MTYLITVSDIMTEDLTTFEFNDRLGAVIGELEKKNLDSAPIIGNGEVRKIIIKDRIESPSTTVKICEAGNCETLKERYLIGPSVSVAKPSGKDLLDKLSKHNLNFSYVVGQGIKGIVTKADLNKSLAKVPFYKRIAKYENLITDYIKQKFTRDQWLDYLNTEDEGYVNHIYNKEKSNNAELSLIECTNTRHLKNILLQSKLWKNFNLFEDQDTAEQKLTSIVNLRNTVMHQKPLIGALSFSTLVKTTNTLNNLIEELNSG